MTAIYPVLDPDDDGRTHINIYSRGYTELGRMLSNFYHSPFEHPKYGKFASMEAFYYYVSTGFEHEWIRDYYGWQAKLKGKVLPKVNNFKTYDFYNEFEELLTSGLEWKLYYNPEIVKKLCASELPFQHYYINPKYPNTAIHAKGSDWLIYGYDFIRKNYRLCHPPGDVEAYRRAYLSTP